MDQLEGIWRLVDCRAWDEGTNRLSAPYCAHPILEVIVDAASDPARTGAGYVTRDVVMIDQQQMLVRTPSRLYGTIRQRREFVWERVWSSGGVAASESNEEPR
jgi:predicted N-acyltransferase